MHACLGQTCAKASRMLDIIWRPCTPPRRARCMHDNAITSSGAHNACATIFWQLFYSVNGDRPARCATCAMSNAKGALGIRTNQAWLNLCFGKAAGERQAGRGWQYVPMSPMPTGSGDRKTPTNNCTCIARIRQRAQPSSTGKDPSVPMPARDNEKRDDQSAAKESSDSTWLRIDA